MQWRSVLVCSLALLAGCGAVFGTGATGTPTEPGTMTPVPVPEVTRTPAEWPLAPGLTGTGVADVDALVAAHRDALGARSFVWRERRGVAPAAPATEATASVPLFTRTVARVESPTVYAVWTSRERVHLGSGPRFVANYSAYADGLVRHVRYRLDGRADHRYRTIHAVDVARNDYVGDAASEAIRRYLAVENATVSTTRVDGRLYYVIASTDAPRSGLTDVREYAVTALVSSDGFVRSVSATYAGGAAGIDRRVRYAFAYSGVNETVVDPPPWHRTQPSTGN